MNERGGTVLVVDDEPNAVKVLSSILAGEGYSVLASEDVDGAIRLMFREDIDAVITDIRMRARTGCSSLSIWQRTMPISR